MELIEAIRTNGTCRYYKPDPVPDAAIARILSVARFAPSGGNRQPLRFIVVRDAGRKRALSELYLPIWNRYIETRKSQLPTTAKSGFFADADYFANRLEDIPVMILVCARLADVHPTDHELGRLSIVGGASVYPAVQNILLAAREEGLGVALTTLLCAEEPKVKALFAIPEDISTAAMVTVGWPVKPFPKGLKRKPLAEIAFAETYGAEFPAARAVT